MPEAAYYDLRIDGSEPPRYILNMMSRREVLAARAAIREVLAQQDDASGDSWASARNRQVASDMRARAATCEE